MISNTRYWFLLLLVVLVYLVGMFVTLFENDSAQFAVMSMRMVQENDFVNLFKGQEEYLDKPHLHYWLAALSFKLFGLEDWAYRIPAIFATLLGAYSCYGLGKLLYNTAVGKLAALIFMTAQTIVLSVIDVRTDAVLTGWVIFAIWQLTTFIEKRSLRSIVLGSIGAGLAFSTKGQIALVVIGLPLLCHLAYGRKWKVLLSWKVLLGLLFFALTTTPMLYAYYQQFDLHPEKVVRGKANRSGIFFIFWEQSFERFSGEGVGKNSSDYFFFFHTFLWVFLPWTVIGLMAYWTRIRTLFKLHFSYNPKYELLTIGGITFIFLIISFAQFKLPHYLNSIIPLFAVLSASYLYSLYRFTKRKMNKVILGIQYVILGMVFIVTGLLCFFVFKLQGWVSYLLLSLLLACIAYVCLRREEYYLKVITVSVCSALLLNAVLNLHFYPRLLEYQAGSSMAQVVASKNIPVEKIYKISDTHTWALDFYNRAPVKIESAASLSNREGIWVYGSDTDLEQLKQAGLDWNKQFTVDQFRITRLQAKFLNPATRSKLLRKMHLVRLH